MSELHPRQQAILQAVIVEYIAAAEPVGSEYLTTKYELGVKPATVRNELAAMADEGFLEQPHTSAGRVPSDKGYRFYVDHLMVPGNPGTETKRKLERSVDQGEALQDMLTDISKALSRITHVMSAASFSAEPGLKVRNILVSALGPEKALLVLVLSNSHVENRLLSCPANLTLEDLGQVNSLLIQLIEGKPLKSLLRIRPGALEVSPIVAGFLETIVATVRQAAQEIHKGKLVIEGIEYMLDQPEFHKGILKIDNIIKWLEREQAFASALAMPTGKPKPITIGAENDLDELRPFAVIRQSFFVGEDDAGTIAIIGPTRLKYDEGVALLDFTARAISSALTKTLI